MNALPDYIIIHFFDWIKKNESSCLNIGYVRECIWRGKHTQNALEGITAYAEEFIRQKKLDISPLDLTESIRFYLIYRNGAEKEIEKIEKSLWDESRRDKNGLHLTKGGSTQMLHMRLAVPTELYVEIEFLEWLLKQELNADDILKMPVSVFEKLAKDFSVESKGIIDDHLLLDLFRVFKDKNPHNFIDKIKRLSFFNVFGRNAEEYKSIAELFCRYSNPRIVKCFFLPLAQDKMFEAFINNSWSDLNSLSKDYLDIFYSTSELSASGYDIKDKFRSLEIAEDVLPCLVLWTDSLDSAQYVELRDLQYTEIFHLLQSIVQNIKTKKDFEVVHAEAVRMADEKRKSHSLTTIIEQRFDISNSKITNSQVGTFESKLSVEDGVDKKGGTFCE